MATVLARDADYLCIECRVGTVDVDMLAAADVCTGGYLARASGAELKFALWVGPLFMDGLDMHMLGISPLKLSKKIVWVTNVVLGNWLSAASVNSLGPDGLLELTCNS